MRQPFVYRRERRERRAILPTATDCAFFTAEIAECAEKISAFSALSAVNIWRRLLKPKSAVYARAQYMLTKLRALRVRKLSGKIWAK